MAAPYLAFLSPRRLGGLSHQSFCCPARCAGSVGHELERSSGR
jgi:hypothetical protein